MDVVLKFVWCYTGENPSKAFEVSFGSFAVFFCGNKVIACAFRLLIEEINKNRMPSDIRKGNTGDESLACENDFSFDGFHPSNSKMMYSL